MRTLQLYGSAAATADAVAQVTIPTAGRIKGIQVALAVNAITDNAEVALELSLVSAGQIAVNGALDPFLSLKVFSDFVTSGLHLHGINQFFPLDIAVRQGEIVYLHCTAAGTITFIFTGIIHYM